MGKSLKTQTNATDQPSVSVVWNFVMLLPLFFVLLFIVPNPVLAQEFHLKLKKKVVQVASETVSNQPYRTLYQRFDYRPKKPLGMPNSIKKELLRINDFRFTEVILQIFSNQIQLDQQKIEQVVQQKGLISQLKPKLTQFLQKEGIVCSPSHPIVTESLSFPNRIFCLRGGGDTILKQVLPFFQDLVSLTSLTLLSVFLITNGKLERHELPEILRIPVDTLFPRQEKNWKDFLLAYLEKSLNFLIKHPQYVIILFLIFYYRKNLLEIFSDKSYRDQVMTQILDRISAIQKMAKSQTAKLKKWASKFFGTYNHVAATDVGKIVELANEINKIPEGTLDLVKPKFSTDVAIYSKFGKKDKTLIKLPHDYKITPKKPNLGENVIMKELVEKTKKLLAKPENALVEYVPPKSIVKEE